MALDPETRCFGLRRVNPFRGVVAVVTTPAGRALSSDGVHWQIEVLAHPPRGLWANDGEQDVLRYYRFGIWSGQDGMSRVPLNPILDAGRMLAESKQLTDQIRTATPLLPFPMGPELELWMLDRDGLPLALLATAMPETDRGEAAVGEWSAGGRDDERPFVSPTLAAQGVPLRDASGRWPHVDALESVVVDAAGPRRDAQWFGCDGDEVVGLEHRADPDLQGRRLARSDLPALSLRTHWAEPHVQSLVDDYLAWLSPYLLTLPDISDAARADLEAKAVHHALLVDALWRLYPRVLDDTLIRRARIEARLRRSAA
jgi:hypothetical protein